MDYDKTAIPQSYDAGRDVSATRMNSYLAFFAGHIPEGDVDDIIDLGCGTGRFSATLADYFAARVIGVDPSQKMLDVALSKTHDDRISFKLAAGETLPLADESCDMVFMSMVFHHLTDPQRVAYECHRVLRPGGHVCLRNTFADEISSYPYLLFFPNIRSIIAGQLISRAQLNALFDTAGFKLLAQQSAWHEVAPDWPAYAQKIALKADSFVARLADDEFNAGLAALQAFAQTAAADQTVGLNVDSVVFRRQ